MRNRKPDVTLSAAPPAPMACADLELADPSPADVPAGHGVRYLVRLHGEPLGFVTAPPSTDGHDVAPWLAHALDTFAERIHDHLSCDGLRPPEVRAGRVAPPPPGGCSRLLAAREDLPHAAVVVPTVGTHPRLRDCVAGLLAQDYAGPFEVVVVDNRPATGAVGAALAGMFDPRLRVVAEPIPGASRARNTGAAATMAEIVAFTDDDAVADSHWLTASVAVLQEHPSVAATTGLVIAGSLETEAQIWFEDSLGFSKGFRRVVWSLPVAPPELGAAGAQGALFPFRASLFGSGNSMAFRRRVLESVGGFDTRLGPGTPALGGEDLDVYVKVLLRGHTLVYEPRAFVRHFHRSSTEELASQMRDYGLGLTAYLTHEVLNHPGAVLAAAARTARRRGRGGQASPTPGTPATARANDADAALSTVLGRLNRRGMLRGPGSYVRSVRAHRRGL